MISTARSLTPTLPDVPSIKLLEEEEEENSKVKTMKPHVPGIVLFADHNRPLPWTSTYHAVVMFADISGFTSLCESYSKNKESGIDKLTNTLNGYLGALVEGILYSDGDILKFAGDAILAIWRVGRIEGIHAEVNKVLKCCLDIQGKCDNWETDIGVKLSVKLGVAAGEMSITFLGNHEYRHYVETGSAVNDVNRAEAFCKSGFIVMTHQAWLLCHQLEFDTELLEDGKHRRVLAFYEATRRKRSMSLPNPDDIFAVQKNPAPRTLQPIPGSMTNQTEETSFLRPDVPVEASSSSTSARKVKMKMIVTTKATLGATLGKLRKAVETVTEMRLDLALRLYILPPVLKKLDDNQPLEYLSEMRQVSIVFMNLVIGTNEDKPKLLQNIFEIVYSQSKFMHGCLNKMFMFDKGCTFLVIFGLPGFKHENDCSHALSCSQRMKETLDELNGIEQVSIGVTTGTTFCGVVGHEKRHEYSVIGRKVNLAARLMMHYPGNISCDENTYEISRLSDDLFKVLMYKYMKGLSNVGIIREFIGRKEKHSMVAKNIRQSKFPLLGRKVEVRLFVEEMTALLKGNGSHRHLVFIGASGVGKTRLLDSLVEGTTKYHVCEISCAIGLEDGSYPHFLIRHLLCTLFEKAGISINLNRDPLIKTMLDTFNLPFLYLLNQMLGTAMERPAYVAQMKVNDPAKRCEVLRAVLEVVTSRLKRTVIIIDDAHNMDTISWEYLYELSTNNNILLVLGLRPCAIEKPASRFATKLLGDSRIRQHDLSSLELTNVAPLACQMLNVVCIPKELESLLRERSHGVPSWCRALLRDLLENKRLIIVLDHDERNSNGHQSYVVPNRKLIKARTEMKEDTEDVHESHSTHSLPSETVEEEITVEEGEAIMESMGIIHRESRVPYSVRMSSSDPSNSKTRLVGPPVPSMKEEKDTEPGRIAKFAKGIEPADIPVAETMKELIIARLDSMRASEQLIVKFASVLGMVVRRDVLETLIPKAHRPKLTRTIIRLMKSGIFVCASKEPQDTCKLGECLCPKIIDSVSEEPYACGNMKFMNNLLQQTSYELLLTKQRLELHAKAAQTLEILAISYQDKIPYYVLAQPVPTNKKQEVHLSESLDAFSTFVDRMRNIKRNNKVADVTAAIALNATQAIYDSSDVLSVIKKAKLTPEKAAELTAQITEEATMGGLTETYLQELLPICHNLVLHWFNTEDPVSCMNACLEGMSTALAINQVKDALVLEEFAEKTMDSLPERLTPDKLAIVMAKFYRLSAQTSFRQGDIPKAYGLMKKTLTELGLRYNVHSQTRLMFEQTTYWELKRHSREQSTPKTFQQGECLAALYSMAKQTGNSREMYCHAVKQFMIASNTSPLHQLVSAYSSMIEVCRDKKWYRLSAWLETELLQICATRHSELFNEDRIMIATIYARNSAFYFKKGNISMAFIAGKVVAEIVTRIQDFTIAKTFAPTFFLICSYIKEYPCCVELLKMLPVAAYNEFDGMARIMYDTLCLEADMAGETPPEATADSLARLTSFNRSADVTTSEMTTRYYAAMTVALWHARIGNWTQMQTWYDYWELLETEEPSLFCILARANKLQCMLLSLFNSKSHKNKEQASSLIARIEKDFKTITILSKKLHMVQPRIEHLKAFFKEIQGRGLRARHKLRSSKKLARKQGNPFEEDWIKQDKKHWFAGKRQRDLTAAWRAMAQDTSVIDSGQHSDLTEPHVLPVTRPD